MEKVKIEREKTIQEIAGEIFTKFGNTEMGRYKIQLMCEEYANECLQKERDKILNENAIENFVCKIWGLEVGKDHSEFTISVDTAISHIKSYLKTSYENK